MSDKARLIQLAGDLQRVVDQLLDCCKEDKDDKDEPKEDSDAKPNSTASMVGLILRKKLKKD